MTISAIIKASKKYISKMYLHTMSIYAYQTITKPNGSKVQELSIVAGQENIPCRVSFAKLYMDDPNKGTNGKGNETYNPVKTRPKIFCNPTVIIKAGDIVKAKVDEKVYEGRAGDILMFDGNHIEFSLGIESEA